METNDKTIIVATIGYVLNAIKSHPDYAAMHPQVQSLTISNSAVGWLTGVINDFGLTVGLGLVNHVWRDKIEDMNEDDCLRHNIYQSVLIKMKTN